MQNPITKIKTTVEGVSIRGSLVAKGTEITVVPFNHKSALADGVIREGTALQLILKQRAENISAAAKTSTK